MSVTVAELNIQMSAAIAALKAGDYRQARIDALAAKGILAALPNGSGQGHATAWDRQAIDDFIAELRRLQDEAGAGLPAAGPIYRVPIVYKRTGGDE